MLFSANMISIVKNLLYKIDVVLTAHLIIQTKGQRKDTKNNILKKTQAEYYAKNFYAFVLYVQKKQQDISVAVFLSF